MPRRRGKTGLTRERQLAVEAKKRAREIPRGLLAKAMATCPFCYATRTSETLTCTNCGTSSTEGTLQGKWRQPKVTPSLSDDDLL